MPYDNEWENMRPVGREIIYDRYSIPATELTSSPR